MNGTRVIGACVVTWKDSGDEVHISSQGGSVEERRQAEEEVSKELEKVGFERTTSWEDIMAKAKRLIQSGNVTILRNGVNNIVAHVVGDHGEYDSEIGREDPNSRAITQWTCDCPWDQFAWQRTRQWKKYEGRPCAHVLATFWQAQSTPLDPDASGQPPTPGQRGPQPQVPADIGGQAPTPVPGPDQGAAPEGAPPMAPPGQKDVLPPPPMQQNELIPPGTLPVGVPAPPGSTVSVPGARPMTPFNPMQQALVYSSWKFGAKEFANGDMVRLEEATLGIMEGKDEAHGAGKYKEIPMNSIGEVISQDPTTGWVDVIFAGPQADAGPLEPYHIQAYIEAEKLTPMNIPKPGPAIKRHI